MVGDADRLSTVTWVPEHWNKLYAHQPYRHVAARMRQGIQRCRRCGYVIQDHARFGRTETSLLVRHKPGTAIIAVTDGTTRVHWREENCPSDIRARAQDCA